MRPRGAWIASFDESACLLSRGYGEGATGMHLGFQPDASDRFLEIVVVAPHAGKEHARMGDDAEAVLLPSGQRATGYYRDYTIAGGKRVLRFSVRRDAITDLTSAASIRLSWGGDPPVRASAGRHGKADRGAVRHRGDVVGEQHAAQLSAPVIHG
jgi:hypothetical protein